MYEKMTELSEFLSEQIKQNNFPGYSYCICSSKGILESGFDGYAQTIGEIRYIEPNSIFDVASLTKAIVTATSFILLKQQMSFNLNTTLAEIYSNRCPYEKRDISVLDLLSHRSGFPAWEPLYFHCSIPEEVLDFLFQLPLEKYNSNNARYSCLGYILLGIIFKQVTGISIFKFAEENIFKPLKMKSTFFHPSKDIASRIAATELGNNYEKKMLISLGYKPPPMRNYLLLGEVHDGNAWFMGGAAGNAGLFSTSNDIAKFSMMLLQNFDDRKSHFFSTSSINEISTCMSQNKDEKFSLGWHLYTPSCSGGNKLTNNAFGHTGFTGCSLWIDPLLDIAIILLTNRVHPNADNTEIKNIRKQFANLAVMNYGKH